MSVALYAFLHRCYFPERNKAMNNIIILSSVTYALKGQKILSENGIPSDIVRTSGVRSVRGCAFGLRVGGAVQSAAAILKNAGIKIYGYTGDGK